MDSSSSSESELPDDILNAAAAVDALIIPPDSKEIYDSEYNKFMEWRRLKNTRSFEEKVLQAYFHEISDSFSPNTLWSKYSKLKATLFAYNNVDITSYSKLKPWLKQKNVGYEPKKLLVFSSQEVVKFLSDAADERWLAVKVSKVL